MLIKQISVFMENKSGRLAEILGLIADNGIDIYALSIADTADFGILRLIVSDTEKTKNVLKEKDILVKSNEVIGVYVENKPGGLFHIIDVLKDKGISIEYSYAFIGKNEKGATVVMKVDKPDEAVKVLYDTDVKVVEDMDIYK